MWVTLVLTWQVLKRYLSTWHCEHLSFSLNVPSYFLLWTCAGICAALLVAAEALSSCAWTLFFLNGRSAWKSAVIFSFCWSCCLLFPLLSFALLNFDLITVSVRDCSGVKFTIHRYKRRWVSRRWLVGGDCWRLLLMFCIFALSPFKHCPLTFSHAQDFIPTSSLPVVPNSCHKFLPKCEAGTVFPKNFFAKLLELSRNVSLYNSDPPIAADCKFLLPKAQKHCRNGSNTSIQNKNQTTVLSIKHLMIVSSNWKLSRKF